jgi:arylsulfatase
MSDKPNFLVIIADDLVSYLYKCTLISQGFSDIGCYGSEIHTPHLDKLSSDAVRMLNYHTASACSPTRAMVLTGTDAHLGGLGCLIEFRNTEAGKKRWGGKPGYEGYLTKDVAPVSEILQDSGYHTILSGKVRKAPKW